MRRLSDIHPAWIAVAIMAAVLLWLATGLIGGGAPAPQPEAERADESAPTKVQVRDSRATEITRKAVVSGRTAPARAVTVRAETSGRVIEVAAERGARIEKGTLIARLAMNDRQARLREASAVREQRRLQYQAAQRMQAKGYQTEVDLAQAKANLESAQAQVEQIREDIQHTEIRAPFAGVLETRPVETGDFVSTGNEIGRVIDTDPLIVRGDVSEDVIGYLEPGQTGTAELPGDRTEEGRLRYIASEADEQTRTYRVELEIPNPDARLIAGASAEMRLPLERVMAHEVEPAILTLDADGAFGINTVGDDDRVHFRAADIVRNRDGKVWLAGLPERLRIITVGQGFVTEGDQVETAVEDGPHASRSASGNRPEVSEAQP